MTQTTEHAALGQRMGAMEDKLDALIDSVKGLSGKVGKIESDVAETREIVAAWKSVKLWAAFLKWSAGLIAAGAVVLAAVKGVWHR